MRGTYDLHQSAIPNSLDFWIKISLNFNILIFSNIKTSSSQINLETLVFTPHRKIKIKIKQIKWNSLKILNKIK